MLYKSKSNNYSELIIVNVADMWRERNVWYPGRSVWHALKEVTTAQGNEAVLNIQKSAEVIVPLRLQTWWEGRNFRRCE